ncbi:ROK family transcriptional regulator [Rhizobium bangladeshense]|uniref:ROK family transcriptional regulator n=1 Tax=Rhizobium bangladeshense TaxID=1138189 RepID=UPI001C915541|nr:ROK family transcriptional regulator [Rhizobium bangladeshense]MBY3598217.1 ROK family transcriptional regulator [Rhizobium bangladeshense]
MAIPSSLVQTPIARKISTNAVIRTVLAKGRISRVDIAKLTGLSKQTISDVVRDLEDDGWLKPVGQTDGRPGRNAIIYEINARAALAVSIDLGGTKIAAAICDLLGNVVAETTVPTDPRGGPHLVNQFSDLITQLALAAGTKADKLRLVVLGSPGVLDPATGHINVAPNIPGIDAMDLRQVFSDKMGIPLIVENDVNLAAQGERWRGHGLEVGNFAFVALGTGVGMGIIANGALLRGARGAAGEIAYLPLGGDAFDPGGFMLGTFESAVGSAAMLRRYAGFGGRNASTVADLFAAFNAGETSAIAAIEETARLVAVAIAAIGAMLDPELVITGGSIGARPELVNAIQRFLPRCTPYPPRIEISRFGNRAALMGGMGIAVERMHDDLFGVKLQDT